MTTEELDREHRLDHGVNRDRLLAQAERRSRIRFELLMRLEVADTRTDARMQGLLGDEAL